MVKETIPMIEFETQYDTQYLEKILKENANFLYRPTNRSVMRQ